MNNPLQSKSKSETWKTSRVAATTGSWWALLKFRGGKILGFCYIWIWYECSLNVLFVKTGQLLKKMAAHHISFRKYIRHEYISHYFI